jgi:CHASE3 domain sensor protein
MKRRIQRTFQVFAPGGSLKLRVIYALAIVRLILAPVIFLTIYYLFRMGAIVNRIVNIDAPVTTLAEQISVDMLRARRSERDYFLLQDPAFLQTNRQALDTISKRWGRLMNSRPTSKAQLMPF